MPSNKQDWLNCGLAQLASGGVISLTIDGLTEAMGLTKGSFYYHFSGVRDYQRQLVRAWVRQELSILPELPKNPGRRLAALDRFIDAAGEGTGAVEAAIYLWSLQDEMVRSELEQVQAARRKFIRSALEPLAVNRERLSLMVDILQVLLTYDPPETTHTDRRRIHELYDEFKRLYGVDRWGESDRQTRLPI